jgi:uncharacterized protein related to proFAR isomerase
VVYAGGGVRNKTDVERLTHAGVAGVLVSTAIHDGTFTAGTFGQPLTMP